MLLFSKKHKHYSQFSRVSGFGLLASLISGFWLQDTDFFHNRLQTSGFFKFKLLASGFRLPASLYSGFWLLLCATLFLLPTTTHAGALSEPPNNLGLVGYWSMNDGNGSTATDFSGNGNDGTLKNMDASTDWVNGRLNSALDFDGSDDYVDVSNDSSLNFNDTSFTFGGWFQTRDITSDNRPMGKFEVSLDTYEIAFGNTSEKISFYLRDNDGDATGFINSSSDFSSNTWYHVFVTVDQSNETAKLYVNGSQEASVDISNIEDITPSGDLAIGHFRGNGDTSGGLTFNGQIDEVRIYNRALSSSEVTDLYNTGFAKVNDSRELTEIPGLKGWWPFDGGEISGSTAEDASGNGNDGTINGASTSIGRMGQALNFDGSDDYVDLPSSLPINGGNFVIHGWIKTSGTSEYIVAGAENPGSYDGGDDYVHLRMDSNGRVNFRFNTFDDPTTVTSSNTYNDNKWHHIVAVRTDNNSAQLYVDGTSVGTDTSSSAGSGVDSTSAINLARKTDNSEHFSGKIDDPRVYDRALTADEIERLYNATRPDDVNTSQNDRLTSGLVGQWSFDGKNMDWTATNEARDTSGNGNHGNANFGKSQAAIGQIGQALDFDGSDDYVSIADGTFSFMNQDGNSFTMSTWVYLDNSSQNTIFLNPDKDAQTWLRFNTSGNQKFDFYIDAGSSNNHEYSNNAYGSGWHFVTGTYDASSETMKLYVNESDTSSGSIGQPAPDSGSSNRLAEYGNGGFNLNGKLDDPRVYDRALTADEIQRLYNMGRK